VETCSCLMTLKAVRKHMNKWTGYYSYWAGSPWLCYGSSVMFVSHARIEWSLSGAILLPLQLPFFSGAYCYCTLLGVSSRLTLHILHKHGRTITIADI
jgi:hypothetical protein